MWDAAKFYCKEAEKSHRAKAYFCALVARGCELEALLRIFDFVETKKTKDRCRDLYGLFNRAFAKHWIPHDALRWWKKTQKTNGRVAADAQTLRQLARYSERQIRAGTGLRRDTNRLIRHGRGVKRVTDERIIDFLTTHDASV